MELLIHNLESPQRIGWKKNTVQHTVYRETCMQQQCIRTYLPSIKPQSHSQQKAAANVSTTINKKALQNQTTPLSLPTDSKPGGIVVVPAGTEIDTGQSSEIGQKTLSGNNGKTLMWQIEEQE